MKLINFFHEQKASFGVLRGESVVDLGGAIDEVASVDDALRCLDEVRQAAQIGQQTVPVSDIQFLPPILRPRLLAMVGLNYRNHIAETGREPPRWPSIFTRCMESLVAHGQPLVRPKVSKQLDFEGELGVIIGKPGRHITAAEALEHVAGYTIVNDGSVRDYQRHTIQFFPGKNFWRSGSIGPWLVTPEELPAPPEMQLTTRLNGTVMQQAFLDELVFGVADLIAYLSDITPLIPGDIIATGTPGGVGAFREPPVWMQPGDLVEVEISGLGILSNRIVDE
jgi:2-keto-4-pentenoate hydratase/2-oxohepta-3-ene-1,7-dioic acid hydratase in catechol pathway